MLINILNILAKYTDIAFATCVMSILVVLLLPVPTWMLDVLLAFSIAISIVVLMTTLFITKPLDLSVFPTILLVTTILRLSLNIASTRLILSKGHNGSAAAGYVIEAFGHFVMQGNVVIGLIVFLILTLINFVVITKGSGRIAEVAARFSLDAMPGKQMAIDADLGSGIINEDTAKKRRSELEQESTFYGSMDGANKFVRGDAVAGIIIIFINLVGGIIIGMVQKGLPFGIAIQTYSMLSIGDGLVSQIPALIISLAAGMIVTKGGVKEAVDKAIVGQLGKHARAIYITAAVLLLVSLLPGLPFVPFAAMALITSFIGYIIQVIKLQEAEKKQKQELIGQNANKQSVDQSDSIASKLQMDLVRIEIGYNLMPIMNNVFDNKLSKQIKALRNEIAQELGFIMPQVRIIDNIEIGKDEYMIVIKELQAAKITVKPDYLLVMNPLGSEIDIDGEDTKDPAFGLPGKWIESAKKSEALKKNYTIVDIPTIITTHLTEVIKENITELLSYSETQKLVDQLPMEHKKLVKDLIPERISINLLQKVLQNLLAELISIRDLATIIESISDATTLTKNPTKITSIVRERLSKQICHANTSPEGFIPVMTLSNEWEKLFAENIVTENEDSHLVMAPSRIHEFISKLKSTMEVNASKGTIPVLLTSGLIRSCVRSIISRSMPSTVVLSQSEIHYKSKIRTMGVV